MKPYHDCKKLFSYIFIILLFISPIGFSSAQTAADDLGSKINQRNTDIAKLEQEIAQYQAELNTIGTQKNSLNSSIKELDLNKKKLNADIAVTQNKIANASAKIENLSSQIGTKQSLIDSDLNAIKSEMKIVNEYETKSFLETFLSEGSFSTAWNDVDNIISLREAVRSKIIELKQLKGQLEDTRSVTMDAKKELLKLQSELADQKKIVEQNTAEKKKLLATTKNNESNYQKLLKDRLAKKDAFEKELRDYESQLKFILNPDLLPGSHVLSWPLQSIFITQLFGKTEAGKRLYANGTHNGVDFRASVGTPVMAMADGTVKGVGNTDLVCAGASFGKFVFIEYNNGLASTYGHLSLIKVSEGQKIARGEIVGYSGNTGYSTGPHLHVSVYAGTAVSMQSRASAACGGHTYYMPISPINAYLDPMIYLPINK